MNALLFLLISSISIPCLGVEVDAKMQEAAAHDLAPVRSMLIFMDTSEEEWGAISFELIAALEQKTAPIIVSDYLLRSIFIQPTLEQFVKNREEEAQANPDHIGLRIVAKNIKQFAEFFSDIQKTIPTATATYNKDHDAKKFLATINKTPGVIWQPYWNATHHERIRSLLRFNPEEWFIEYSSGFFMLTPKTSVPAGTLSSSCTTGTLTAQQLALGLKLGCFGLEIPTDRFARVITASPAASGENFVHLLCGGQAKEKCISPIFITRSEYAQHSIAQDKIPQWIVYVAGHGTLHGGIAGFDVQHYQQLLNFCDTKIVTKLFISSTCYGATSHAAHLFLDKERKEKRIKNYSFPIMCGAIPDVPIYIQAPTMGIPGSFTLDDIDLDRGTLRLHTFPNFKQSVELASRETISYGELTRALIPKGLTLDLMLVKPAYLEWTSLIDANNVTVSLSKTLALTRTKPLAISTLVKKGAPAPQAILLYAHHIPFELIFDTKPVPKLISMIPGKCFHVIDNIKVSMRSLDFVNTIAEFLPDAPKIVWIKEIQGINPEPTHNCIIDVTNKKNYTIYTTRVGEYRKQQIKNGIKESENASEDPKDNYVVRYENLLRPNPAYRREEEERKQIQAIAEMQKRREAKTHAAEREAKKEKA